GMQVVADVGAALPGTLDGGRLGDESFRSCMRCSGPKEIHFEVSVVSRCASRLSRSASRHVGFCDRYTAHHTPSPPSCLSRGRPCDVGTDVASLSLQA